MIDVWIGCVRYALKAAKLPEAVVDAGCGE